MEPGVGSWYSELLVTACVDHDLDELRENVRVYSEQRGLNK